MSAPLATPVPEHWKAALRPYLQRAEEFFQRQVLVSYYLYTYVAFLCLQKRTKEDKEGTSFLMALLTYLEELKKTQSAALADPANEGRTVLTRFALMLFAKADDEERSGKASLIIVRLFFSSACLLEATAQFTEDKKMDNIAASKCKYAKYTAARMKKCLDANEPYVSKNVIEPPVEGDHGNNQNNNNHISEGGNNGGGSDGFFMTPSGNFTTAPPSSYLRKPSQQQQQQQQQQQMPPPPQNYNNNNNNNYNNNYNNNNNDAPPPSYSMANDTRQTQQQPQQQQQQQPSFNSSANNYNQNQNQNESQNNYTYTPPPMQQQQQHQQQQQPQYNNTTYTNNVQMNSNQKASVDAMIDSQKYARQAVNALSFYDHVNARKQLLIAMDILNGKPVPPPASGK